VAAVGFIYYITTTAAGFIFPVAILALVPLRLVVLPRLLGEAEINALDPRTVGGASGEESSEELTGVT
jgi:hypothetical protein